MELDETIRNRFSARAFLNQPVARSVIEEILALAVRSPSWGNTQPWEIGVVSGESAKNLAARFVANITSGIQTRPDFPMPDKFVEPFMTRYRAVGRVVFAKKGIGREDQQARVDHYLQNVSGFGAPTLLYLMVDQGLATVYPVFDAGLLAAHICLLATSRGLGTCLLAALSLYPDEVRNTLGVGPEKKIVLGLALGHPDLEAPVNGIKTEREPLGQNVSWAE
ncbi:MAG: nitroreductase [Pseudomonadota bacterium]